MGYVLFFIGKPGSGKSEFRDATKKAALNVDHSLKIFEIDELDILLELKDTFSNNDINLTEQKQVIVENRALFSEFINEVQKRLVEGLNSYDLILCEFSRARYTEVLSILVKEVYNNYKIIYIDTPFKICIDRNEKRKSDSKKYVPKEILLKYYCEDDLAGIKNQFKRNIEIIDNSKNQFDNVYSKAKEIVNLIVIPHFSFKHTTYQERVSTGEIVVPVLLIIYLISSIWLGYLLMFYPTEKMLIDYQLKLFGIAISGGTLGSTLYCVRSFYSYYMDGLFNFKKLKWWYLFRPITGAILAIALLALIKSQVIILTSTDIKNNIDSELSILSISFLAGFSTEQVIERLRKASKALFGEEDDKGKKIKN